MRDADLFPGPLLISLGPPQVQDDALASMLDIRHVQSDHLGASQSASETDEQKGPIPGVLDAIAHPVKHQQEVISEQGAGLPLRATVAPPDAPHCRGDEF